MILAHAQTHAQLSVVADTAGTFTSLGRVPPTVISEDTLFTDMVTGQSDLGSSSTEVPSWHVSLGCAKPTKAQYYMVEDKTHTSG